MVKIYYTDISSIQDFDCFTKDFSFARLSYVNSISNEMRRKQSVMAWWLLLKVIRNEYNSLSQFDFCLDKSGKWYEKNSLLNFSLAHSGNIVLVGISDNLPISVDVEQVSDKLFSIAKIFQNEENNKTVDLIELAKFWTKRECLIKESSVNHFNGLTVFDKGNKQYYLNVGVKEQNSFPNEMIKVNID